MTSLLTFPVDLLKIIDEYAEEIYDPMVMGKFSLKEILQDLHDLKKYVIKLLNVEDEIKDLEQYAEIMSRESYYNYHSDVLFSRNIDHLIRIIKKGSIKCLEYDYEGPRGIYSYIEDCYAEHMKIYKNIDFMIEKLMDFHFNYLIVIRKIHEYNEYMEKQKDIK